MLREQHRRDDGRRRMPKADCPLCNRRAVDVRTRELKNSLRMVEAKDPAADIILICPACHHPIGIAWKKEISSSRL